MSALPDAAARAEALDLAHHILAMAPAGSGKTGLLVQRMLRALATVEEPEQVVAITFTNKAAAEIRNRVLEALRAALHGPAPGDVHGAESHAAATRLLAHDRACGWHLLDAPARLRATTIDSFNAQLATQLPLSSGLGGPVRIADDAWPLYAEAVTRLFAELEDRDLAAEDRNALQVLLRLADNRIDRLLPRLADMLARREQWLPRLLRASDEAWESAESELLHLMIEHSLHELQNLLGDATCTELVLIAHEAAQQHELFAWATDIEAWPDASADALPQWRQLIGLLLTNSGGLRKKGGISIKSGFIKGQAYTARMKDLCEGWDGDGGLEAACVAVRKLPDADYPESLRELKRALLRVMRRLAAHLRIVFGERGETDFQQIAQSALAALRPPGEDGAAYGEALLASDRRIRHLLVDEMQDTSEAQIALLLQLTEGWQPGDGRSLFLVGDPQQSIYAFRKAEVRLFLDLWREQRLGELPLRRLALSANFRSLPAVVDWFNAAFERIFPPQEDADIGLVPFSPSVPQRNSAPGGVEILGFAREQEDAAALRIAADAAQLIQGGSVAVLGRTRGVLAPVIRALRARGLSPACQDIDALAALPAVRDYVATARALWHPADRLSWTQLLRAPFVGLSWADLLVLSRGQRDRPWPERLRERADDAALSEEGRARVARLLAALEACARDAALRTHLADRTEALWQALGGPGCIDRDELDDLRATQRLLRQHSRGGGIADLEALQRGLDQLYASPRAGQIQVMTVHKAKGLEFDHVLLVGTHKGPRNEDKPLWHLRALRGAELLVPQPPQTLAEDDPAHRLYDWVHEQHVAERRAETLRLLYVAVTRAKRSLRLYACADTDDAGFPKFAAHSFARLLEPVIAPQWSAFAQTADSQAAADRDASVPRAPRLPLDYRFEPALTGLYRPVETRTLKPSEAVLDAQDNKLEWRAEDIAPGDIYAQLVGTLYHETLEKIAKDGLAAWSDRGASRRDSLAAGLRRMGLPAPQVDAAVSRVLELVARTLDSERGRWILDTKPWARNEYHLAAYLDDRWVSAVIDRCFEDADGTLWIIDYKAAARPVEASLLDAYVAQAGQRYASQMEVYVRLLGGLMPGRTIRAALYFAETAQLLEAGAA